MIIFDEDAAHRDAAEMLDRVDFDSLVEMSRRQFLRNQKEIERLIDAMKRAENAAGNGWANKATSILSIALEPYRAAKRALRSHEEIKR